MSTTVDINSPFYCQKLDCKGVLFVTCIRRQQTAANSRHKERNSDNLESSAFCNECLDCEQGRSIAALFSGEKVRQRECRAVRAKKGQRHGKHARKGENPYSPHYVGEKA